MSLPQDLKYSEDHEWVKVEGNTVTIGITDFAQSELGDIVFVELPEEGDDVSTGESFGSVESVKTVSELIAPVSGSIVAINEELEDSPERAMADVEIARLDPRHTDVVVSSFVGFLRHFELAISDNQI